MEMMNVFAVVCNMTVTGSIVIGCVLLVRLVLGKAPKVFSWALWLAVLLRLLCPVSIEGPASVLEFVDAPRNSAGMVEFVEPLVQAPLETIPVTPEQEAPAGDGAAVTPIPEPVDWGLIGTRVWLAAAGGLLAYGIISYVNMKQKLRESVPAGKGVRETDGIATPFVLGRTIYLPAGLGAEERDHILLHERMHIRHGDPIVKALFWLAVCLHWFNPLVWLSFFLCGRDMELYCDEAVLKKMGGEIRSDYAQSLLDLASGRRFAPVPLAFGEGNTGKRVKFVLSWKKTKLWIAIPAAVLCIATLVLTGCDPVSHPLEEQWLFGKSYRAEAVLGQEVPAEGYYSIAENDGRLFWKDGTSYTELGGLVHKRLDSGFALSDAALEQKLRQENELAWKNGEYWLLYQKDGALYLTEGRDRVLRLDVIRGIDVYFRNGPYSGDRIGLKAFPAGSGLPDMEQIPTLTVGGETTLVFTQSVTADTLTVREEYHQAGADGSETVTQTEYVLDITADYGYELPVARRGDHVGDWAIYRIDAGLSSYVCCVRFGMEVQQEELQEVTFSEVGAYITLQLPGGWEYAITTLAEDEYNPGIDFWPLGREEGKLHFGYYPDRFAVCGTGLETTQMTLAGRTATVGTYDDHTLWDYISFGEYFAVWGHNQESWWAEYGPAAMEILDTAVFGKE